MIQSKQDIQKQLDEAYRALAHAKDRHADGGSRGKGAAASHTQRVLSNHIRYLKQLLKEQS